MGRDTAIDMRDFTAPIDYCVEVDWPGRNSFSTGYRRPAFGRAAPWVGSLIYHGRDPSGQMYRRNRFYDPATGRFTQEDPIGIAGGLNVYGYAEGDPVSYSDPYGLSADCCRLDLESSRQQQERMLVSAGESSASLIGAARDFLRNYRNMREAGRELVNAGHSAEGNDKYFHCRANCDASQRGAIGRFSARVLSDIREVFDRATGDPASASAADQEANRRGRAGAQDGSGRSCQQVCDVHRPRHLPERY